MKRVSDKRWNEMEREREEMKESIDHQERYV